MLGDVGMRHATAAGRKQKRAGPIHTWHHTRITGTHIWHHTRITGTHNRCFLDDGELLKRHMRSNCTGNAVKLRRRGLDKGVKLRRRGLDKVVKLRRRGLDKVVSCG